MTDGERYTILAKKKLSREDREYIIAQVRGATIAWSGDMDNVEETEDDYFKYTLTCTRLTPENKTDLQLSGLELKFIQIN